MIRLVVALVLLPISAQSLTFTGVSRVTTLDASVDVYASDGVATIIDQTISPSTDALLIDLIASESGSAGIVDPLRSFSGHILASPSDTEWDGSQGAFSQAVASVTFENLELEIEGDPLGWIFTSGSIYDQYVPGIIRGSGTLMLGQVSTPFAFEIETPVYTKSEFDPGRGLDQLSWRILERQKTIATIQSGPVIYDAKINFGALIFVPEPSTALLFGLGLAGLATSRPAAASARRG